MEPAKLRAGRAPDRWARIPLQSLHKTHQLTMTRNFLLTVTLTHSIIRGMGVIAKSIKPEDVLLEDIARMLRNIPSKVDDKEQLTSAMEAAARIVDKIAGD